MNGQHFDQFKNVYQDIQPPEHLARHGWEELSHRLPAQEKPRMPILRYGFIFAGILLCLTAGVVGASQTAQPGTILYPVKAASEQVSQTITNTFEKKPIEDPTIVQPNTKIIPAKATPTPTLKLAPTITKETEPENENQTVQRNNKTNSSNGRQSESSQNNNGSSRVRQQQVEGIKTEKEKENNGNNENKNDQKPDNSGKGNQKNK